MAAPLPDAALLGVWVSDDWRSYGERWAAITQWATAHLPDGGRRTYRAEFWLLDAPFAILHNYQEDATGRLMADPERGGEPVRAKPVTLLLAELPPAHLLVRG